MNADSHAPKKITILNFEENVFVKFIFSKDATMINPLIHGGKKGHTYLKKVATKN